MALIADTHGFLDPRVEQLVARCDICIHAGDVGNGAVLRALRPRTGRVVAVLGNNDVAAKWPAGDGELLQALPEQARVSLPGGELVVVHGHRNARAATRHAQLRTCFADARAVVYGHSHRLSCDQEQSPWVLNPGAAGRARTYGGPSCLLLFIRAGRWRLQRRRFSASPKGVPRGA